MVSGEAAGGAEPGEAKSSPQIGSPSGDRGRKLLVVIAMVVAMAGFGIGILISTGIGDRATGDRDTDNALSETAVADEPATTSTTIEAPTTTEALTTTTAEEPPPPANVEDFDFGNWTYRNSCLEPIPEPVELVDGFWTAPEGDPYGTLVLEDVFFEDMTGDGEVEAVVQLRCSSDPNRDWASVQVFRSTPDGPSQVGRELPGYGLVTSGMFFTEYPLYEKGELDWGPIMGEQIRWGYDDGDWIEIERYDFAYHGPDDVN